MRFYLGTHEISWLAKYAIPFFISDRRLRRQKKYPRALCYWALDSGGFTELGLHGRWTVTPQEYVARVRRYMAEIGQMQWAATQDWMCEPHMIERTGLSVKEHQLRSIFSYITLMSLAPEVPWLPTLQGWARPDYYDHVEMYAKAGIDLSKLPIVGVGSVCRRQAMFTAEILMRDLHDVYGLNVHGFGFKKDGVKACFDVMASCDSLAWSESATHRPPLPGHDQPGPGRRRGHQHCNNCAEYAIAWRRELIQGCVDDGYVWRTPGALIEDEFVDPCFDSGSPLVVVGA